MSNKKTSAIIITLCCIIVIQLGVIVYLLIKEEDKKQIIVQNVETIQNDSLELATKKEEFRLVGEDLKKLKEEMIAMGMDKDSMGAELDEMLEALWNVEMGDAINIDNLNSKIAAAKKLLVVKDLQIKRLKDQSDSLSFEAKVLKSEKTAQVDQISEMLNDTKKLSEKVKLAARVKAENIIVYGINKKGKLLSKEEYKSKDIDKVNVRFNLMDNKFTRTNAPIVIRYRIIGKGPVVYFNETIGGGFFKNIEGEELAFTGSQLLQFDNTKQVVSFEYQPEKPFVAGLYKVELFADGYSIGESQFKVK